jgi:ADP-ribose pyrophosphatase YjhB (NUDIX family)
VNAPQQYAPVDHPGVDVPEERRPWSVAWPEYDPVDITPAELRPAGLAASVAEGWAEPWHTPADVPDWDERLARAVLPFTLDERGWPLNPSGRTGRAGRNLGAWGENAATDAAVFAGTRRNRRVLLIRRSDTGTWAMPGGMGEKGEKPAETLPRELREETNVDLAYLEPAIIGRFYVQDWRATDSSWVVTTLGFYLLNESVPAVGGDDATAAAWWPAPDLATLENNLAACGGLYEAHRPLLAFALDHADSVAPAKAPEPPQLLEAFYASDDALTNGGHLGYGAVWPDGSVTIHWRATRNTPAGDTRFDSIAQARQTLRSGGTRLRLLAPANPTVPDGAA